MRPARWASLALLGSALAAGPPPAEPAVSASIDLSQPFGTRSAWRFTATQGPAIDDPTGLNGDQAPGAVTVCLRRTASGPCDPQLQAALRTGLDDDPFAEPHYLNQADIVRPGTGSGRPILLVVTASLHAGDGDQVVKTQALAYEAGQDRFVRVYEHATGRNNNQEVRFMAGGPLAGDIISVEPAETAPFGFWVSVNSLGGPDGYTQQLRYRSATMYADGNPLPVIDSEMANIEQRLGLWRPGSPLPLPATPCPKPHLIRMELWCQ